MAEKAGWDPATEYTECQGFSPVVIIGSPRTFTCKRVLPPTPLVPGGGGHTRLRERGRGEPVRTKGQTPWCSRYTVRKMDLILRPIERRPQMQFSIARRFKLMLLRRYSVKFSKMRNFMLGTPRVGNFRQKNNSAEDGIDGTNGYFRRNSGCSVEQKLSEFRSEPFRGIENNSEFRSVEQKLKNTHGIPFKTLPRKRK